MIRILALLVVVSFFRGVISAEDTDCALFGDAATCELIEVCPGFEFVEYGTAYDPELNEVEVFGDAIEYLQLLPTEQNLWIGYENGGFSFPLDSTSVLNITLYTASGSELWIDILSHESTPGRYFVLPFETTEAYSDASGAHLGTHPCIAFEIDRDTFTSVLDHLELPHE